MEIDLEKEKTKYQTEFDRLVRQLQQLNNQREQTIQAIQERQGILAFLDSLKEDNHGDIPTTE